MSTSDRYGNLHREDGQFTHKKNTAPATGLTPPADEPFPRVPLTVTCLDEPDPVGGHDLEIEAPTGKYYLRGGRPHRLDGPAYEGRDGTEEWQRNGVRHRDPSDGPAFIDADGHEEYWDHGRIVAA